MDEVEAALFEGWINVRQRLLADVDELRARLARRRLKEVVSPPRAMCVALRASDRRINEGRVMVMPPSAVDPGHERLNCVRLDGRLARELCEPLRMTMWRGQTGRQYAAAVGRTLAGIYHLRKRGLVCQEFVKGYNAYWGHPVPFVWNENVIDPQCANGFRPVHPAWGSLWQSNAGRIPADFKQDIQRAPCFRRRSSRDERRRFIGWRWICPGCKTHVRTLYFPVPMLTLSEYWGDEAKLLALAGTTAELDGVPRTMPAFACARCHEVKFWTPLAHNGWNQLVSYYSGGLMYGREAKRPPELSTGERRHAKPAKAFVRPSPRRDEVEKLLREGKKRREIAKELGLSRETVNVHVKAIFKRAGVHSQGELAGTD